MATISSYVVVSFRKAIATTSVFSLGPNGVDFIFSLLLRQNTGRNHNGDRLSRSSSTASIASSLFFSVRRPFDSTSRTLHKSETKRKSHLMSQERSQERSQSIALYKRETL
ncbi:BnaA07g09600D [Brassica napus]|uniref:(rape) hypothetical protein n=1 Tax=Brassica napus TaxID=3708 RepID=A0A078GL05_BRANA|nr:unnamed protein product [Brassica napus]CDY25822.1 BnaA07g09600D [Brassica napus]